MGFAPHVRREVHCPHCSHLVCFPQSVQMFIDEKISYLDIIKLNEACCEVHKKDLVALPNLEEIVHYDQWARKWVKDKVESGNFSKVYA